MVAQGPMYSTEICFKNLESRARQRTVPRIREDAEKPWEWELAPPLSGGLFDAVY